MAYVPLGFEGATFFNNMWQPSTEKYINNVTFRYFERCLFQRCINILDFKLPDEWVGTTLDFFKYVLFRDGFCTVFYTPEYGITFQPCVPGGQGLYYQPTFVLVSNPVLSTVNKLDIGKECELLKLTPDYIGVFDVIGYYAEKLSLLAASLDMTFINSRIAYILGAKNKAAANSLKTIVDKISAGQSTIIYDKVLLDDLTSDDDVFDSFDRQNVKNGYLGTEFLENIQTLIYQFDQEIGIPTPPGEKGERMITSEVTSKIIDTTCRASIWEETFNSSAEFVNDMFGTNISCRYKYKDVPDTYNKGGDSIGISKPNA